MFSIFNTTTTTLPLIDNIKLICFEDLTTSLSKRQEGLAKEISNLKNDDESLKKQLKTSQDRLKEEEIKQQEMMNKTNEEVKKDSKGKPIKGK